MTSWLDQALMGYLRAKGVHCSTTIAGWHRFFSEMVRQKPVGIWLKNGGWNTEVFGNRMELHM